MSDMEWFAAGIVVGAFAAVAAIVAAAEVSYRDARRKGLAR